jgi:CRP-like cAMP-binding protein
MSGSEIGQDLPLDIKRILESFSLFSQIIKENNNFIKDISKSVQIRKQEKGGVICHQGESAKAIFFVVKGTVRVMRYFLLF